MPPKGVPSDNNILDALVVEKFDDLMVKSFDPRFFLWEIKNRKFGHQDLPVFLEMPGTNFPITLLAEHTVKEKKDGTVNGMIFLFLSGSVYECRCDQVNFVWLLIGSRCSNHASR